MLIGAHVSTAGGPVTAFERAEAIGAEAAQIFLTPPQQWRSSKVDTARAGRGWLAITMVSTARPASDPRP